MEGCPTCNTRGAAIAAFNALYQGAAPMRPAAAAMCNLYSPLPRGYCRNTLQWIAMSSRPSIPPRPPTPKEEGGGNRSRSNVNEDQMSFLAQNPESAPGIIELLRTKGTLPPRTPSLTFFPSFGGPSQMATEPDFSAPVDPVIESAVLGKRPQPPSPAPSALLPTSSPARVSVPPSVPGSQHTPLPHPLVPAIDWAQYFDSFQGVLAALNADHAMVPQFLGIMLTGLQSLLQDQRYLSLQVDGGFSIANLLDALPRPPHLVLLKPDLVRFRNPMSSELK
jgi:hypothetical protein